MEQKIIGSIFESSDYEAFKHLEGNRHDAEKRAVKIMDSIHSVGYINNPIVVNEKMEVIDGAGRLEALRQLHLPVRYVIAEGAGIDECIAMNVNQKNWSLNDYVISYVEQGDENYAKLENLMSMSKLAADTTYYLTKGRYGRGDFGTKTSIIKSGGVYISDEEYERAVNNFTWINTFNNIDRIVGGRYRCTVTTLLFFANLPGVDKDRLRDKVSENVLNIIGSDNTIQMLEQYEDIYNKGLSPDKRIYPVEAWKRYIADTKRRSFNG